MTDNQVLTERVIRQAEHLLHDAALLHDTKRFRTSIALSIIAMEECAKLWQVAWIARGKGDKQSTLNHRTKQAIFGFLVLSVEIEDWFLEKVAKADEVAEQFDAAGNEDSKARSAAIRSALETTGMSTNEFADHFAKGAYPRGMAHVSAAVAGNHQRLKHACLYTEIDADNDTIMAEFGLEDVLSAEWLTRAGTCLEITRTRLPGLAGPTWAMIAEITRRLPKDVA
jgi:AbiV family abortive infection protein